MERKRTNGAPRDRSWIAGIAAAAFVLCAWWYWYTYGAEQLGRHQAVASAAPAASAAERMAARGQFGDLFGVMNALFSAAAFAALFWSSWMQRHQNAVQQWEITEHWRDQEHAEKRLIAGHLETIALDVQLAERLATGYLAVGIEVPGYRHPLFGMSTALPHLIAAGVLRGSEAVTLSRFYVDASSWNRALDAAHALRGGSETLLQNEIKRARLKAHHLVRDGSPSRFVEAMAVLHRHLSPETIERLEFDDGITDEQREAAVFAAAFADVIGGPSRPPVE